MMSSMRYHIFLLTLLVVGLLSFAETPAHGALPVTVVGKGQQGCATGTTVANLNKVFNGDFSIDAGPGPSVEPAAGFTSELPNVGPNTYPYDEAYVNGVSGGLSIISTQVFTVTDRALVYGYRFAGDPRRDVPPLDHYLYTKPSSAMYTDGDNYAVLWSQPVTLTVGTTYNFYAYFNNMRIPSVGDNNFINPKIQLLVNGTPAGSAIEIFAAPDEWLPVQFSFKLDGASSDIGKQSSVSLEIRDYAGVRNVYASDDFAMTGVNLRQCVSALGVALASMLPIDNHNGTYDIPFVVSLKNYGVDPLPLSNVQVIADLASAFQGVQSFQVVSISSQTMTVNPGFNGSTDKRLLSVGNALNSKATAEIRFTVRVTPGSGPGAYGPFNPQVGASADAGVDAGAPIQVIDVSVPGLDPDPNGDQDTKDPNEDTPTPVYLTPFKLALPGIRR